MKMNTAIEPVKEFIGSVAYYLKNNMFAFTCVVQAVLPGFAFVMGSKLSDGMLLPFFIGMLLIQLATSYIKKVMVNIGAGNDMPIPRKRFTVVDSDGEVSVRVDRTQELILYVCDVENYLTRKGKLK